MKPIQRQKARELRAQGKSIKQIAKILEVSQSSISTWVRDVELTQEQIKILEQQNPLFNRQISGAKIKSDKAKDLRKTYQENGKIQALRGDLLHQAGCLLYWAEGAKTRNQCRFTNSDVEMVKLFLGFIRKFYPHLEDKITLTINYYTNNGLSSQEIKTFWLQSLNLKETSLRKCRPRSMTNAIRHNKLPYGIACICICSSELTQNIYGAIQQYAGFDNEYMLM